jgi:hypothetical protein
MSGIIATDALVRGRFVDPRITADGKPRAAVQLRALTTLWFNTGTLCNVTCKNCYIESSPRNDRLAWLTAADVEHFLDEIARDRLPVTEIGLTGGEPFMNPSIIPILTTCLERDYRVLVLTNAMRPMMKCCDGLLELKQRFGDRLTLRVSIDHFDRAVHEAERGRRSWQPMVVGVQWLCAHEFRVRVAGRRFHGESEHELRDGFARLFAGLDIPLDALDPAVLVLFPEMHPAPQVPEITTACWDLLGVDPNDMMCASARMVVRRRAASRPEVVACTLLPYEPNFSLGATLAGSLGEIPLNHPHCAEFCVLGGGSCSAAS